MTRTRLVALLLGMAALPAYGGGNPGPGMSFKDFDTNKNGYLSLDEFKDKGKDDLAFKAADIDGDERVDRDEFDKYLSKKATDRPGSGAGGQAEPQPPAGY